MFLLASLIALVLAYTMVTMAGGWDGAVLGPRAGAMATTFVGLADDPIGKPKGNYTTFFQTYGAGFLWYF
jgi:hypothetical protein